MTARRLAPTALLASLLFAAFALAATPAAADEATETRAVIELQLDAISRDAWNEAYAFAAPSIQRRFPSPEIFADMVRGGYPMVWRPADVEFLSSGYHGGAASSGLYEQRLRFTDAAGATYLALYTLRQVDGSWRITGVMIREEPASAA